MRSLADDLKSPPDLPTMCDRLKRCRMEMESHPPYHNRDEYIAVAETKVSLPLYAQPCTIGNAR